MRSLLLLLCLPSIAMAELRPELAASVRLTQSREGKTLGMATGVVLSVTDVRTVIGTSSHVLDKFNDTQILVEGGEETAPLRYNARLADWWDNGDGLAIVVVDEKTTLKAATIGGYDTPSTGSKCVWVGCADGTWPKLHDGVILSYEGGHTWIEVSPNCEAGDSGGGVWVDGKLYGCCFGRYPKLGSKSADAPRGVYSYAYPFAHFLTDAEREPHGFITRKELDSASPYDAPHQGTP